jgi:hypothetical protein
MTLVIDRIMRGNRREVPPDLPIGLWWTKIEEFQSDPLIDEIPWYHESLECLPLDKIRRVKAKALFWRDIMGEWPKDISVWWEVRQARKAGVMPWPVEIVQAVIDEDDVLHCGKCEARWSAPRPAPFWCKLCGSPQEIALNLTEAQYE